MNDRAGRPVTEQDAAPSSSPNDGQAFDSQTPVLEADTLEPTAELIEQPLRAAQSAAGRTFEALGYRDYRYFFIGAMLSNVGTWMQNVAQASLITMITGSSLWLGIVMFAGGLPTLFLALPAGVLADRLDRRRLILWGQAIVMLLAFWLAYLVQTSSLGRGNWGLVGWVIAMALGTGAVTAATFPAWQAMVPDLVSKETLLNAISLNSAQFHAARMIGPAIAAALMARLGMASAFWANAVSYLAVIWALWIIHPKQAAAPAHGPSARESTMDRLLGGVRYARENRAVAVLLTSVAITTFFGMAYVLLMPLFVTKTLHESLDVYGYLMAANGMGALFGALGVAYLARVAHRPTLIRAGILVFSSCAIAVTFARSWLVALPIMILAGAAFLTMQSAVSTSLQTMTPPHVRGRVMALFILSFMGIMPLGSLAFGALGQFVGVPTAIAVGAAVCLGWGVALTVRPRLLAGTE